MDQLLPLQDESGYHRTKPFKASAFGALSGFIVIILIPYIHFGIISPLLWGEAEYKVNKEKCTCSCWDVIFKGAYERGPGKYKHIYFNITPNTFKIWVVTMLTALLGYEASKRTVRLVWERSIRLPMLLLLIVGIFPQYFSCWIYFNYWNDEFYQQWNHQLFFSITELISAVAVMLLLDKNVNVTAKKTLLITNIALIHVISASYDQFVDNVLRGNGTFFQALRDVFLMIPDLLHIFIPFWELHRTATMKKQRLMSKSELLGSVVMVLLGFIIVLIL